jgi:hypothetical protein
MPIVCSCPAIVIEAAKPLKLGLGRTEFGKTLRLLDQRLIISLKLGNLACATVANREIAGSDSWIS